MALLSIVDSAGYYRKDYVCAKFWSILDKRLILKYKLPYKTLNLMHMTVADSVIGYGWNSYGLTYNIENYCSKLC